MPSFEKYVRNPAEEGATPEDPSKIEGPGDFIDDESIVKNASSSINRELKFREALKNKRLEIANAVADDNRRTREWLIARLYILSAGWLIFTALILTAVAFGWCHLANSVALCFITSSLGTVLGLWAFGLKYFFSHEGDKNSRDANEEFIEPE